MTARDSSGVHTGSLKEREMTEKSLFISSCSRRQLARRRSGRSLRRLVTSATLLFAVIGALALLAGRGGF